jgi:hypothetical protein
MAEQHDFFIDPERPDPQHLIKVEDAGHWHGDVFWFTPPIRMNGATGPVTMGRLDMSDAQLADGVSRDDVISAFLNPVAAVDEDGDHYRIVP